MIYPHAIKIMKPDRREQMPTFAFALKVMKDWCSNYVVTEWECNDSTFFFGRVEDIEAFKERFGITIV